MYLCFNILTLTRIFLPLNCKEIKLILYVSQPHLYHVNTYKISHHPHPSLFINLAFICCSNSFLTSSTSRFLSTDTSYSSTFSGRFPKSTNFHNCHDTNNHTLSSTTPVISYELFKQDQCNDLVIFNQILWSDI